MRSMGQGKGPCRGSGRRHLMRGSCPSGTPERDLSQRVPQVEGADRVAGGVGPVEEAPVDAAERVAAGALDRLLDAERAARERLAGQADGSESDTRALGLGEQLDV